MIEQPAIDERADLVGDELGLGLGVFGHHQPCQRSGWIVGDQARGLVEEVAERIGEADQVRGRAVIVNQGDHRRGAGVQVIEVEQKGRVSSEPAENRLQRITGDSEVAMCSASNCTRATVRHEILALVDDHPAKR